MYLAKTLIKGVEHYSIRQSFFDETAAGYRYRTIFDLGTNPSHFVHLIDEEFCYFSEELEDSISHSTQADPSNLLEDLLWDFIPFDARQRLSYFRGRGTSKLRPFTSEDRKQVEQQVHLFDKRRLYYLRYGAVDQSRINQMHEKLCRPLLGQCRDEREFYFIKQEYELSATEYKVYVFAAFDLQLFFTKSYSTFMPEGLNPDKIADHFTHALCTLNENQAFWGSSKVPTHLHPHLVRYLIMFFDYDFVRGIHANEYIRQFMNNHRTFRWPERKTEVSDDQVQSIFGKSINQLKKMDRTAFIKLFRKKAKELHPDKGGDHEQFILLVEIYNGLLGK